MTDLVIPENPQAVVAAADDPEAAVLVMLDRGKEWLVEATRVEHISDLRAKAEAIRVYCVQAKLSKEAEQAACELRIRAERRTGELLASRPKNKGGRPPKTPGSDPGVSEPTLAELGVGEDESRVFQKLAEIPKPEFEEKVDDLKADSKLSRAALLAEQKAKAAAERAEQDEFFRTITPDGYDPTNDRRRQAEMMALQSVVAAVKRAGDVAPLNQWAADAPSIARLLPSLPSDVYSAAEALAVLAQALEAR